MDRLRSHAQTVVVDRVEWHIPPVAPLFVQRKESGIALLAVRMQARLPLREKVSRALAETPDECGA